MLMTADFAERHLLPIVCAFAVGVLITTWAHRAQAQAAPAGGDDLHIVIECLDLPADIAPAWHAPQPVAEETRP